MFRLLILVLFFANLTQRVSAEAKNSKQSVVKSEKKKETNKAFITITQNLPEALYKFKEKAVFTVTIKDSNGELINKGTINAKFTKDGVKQISAKSFDLENTNPFTISETLNTPGFLRLICSMKIDDLNFRGTCVVGYEPLKIMPALPEPKDFDEFWKNSRTKLAKLPIDLKIKIIESKCNNKQNAYQISFANIRDTRIYGFLSVPKGKGPFPAIVGIPGAGWGKNNSNWVTKWGNQGVIGLYMNVHSYDPFVTIDLLKKKYKELNKKGIYSLQGAPNRDEYFFKKSILGISRAIDYIASRLDFDKKHFVAYGSSQGGGHSLILTGLNKNITAVIANVPALCDHGGYLKDRTPGWPRVALYHKKDPAFLAMSGYFDVVNFARRIKVPTLICVGFLDTTCSPSSVYAAYNVIKAPKTIINEPTMGHDFSKRFINFANKWDKMQLGLSK